MRDDHPHRLIPFPLLPRDDTSATLVTGLNCVLRAGSICCYITTRSHLFPPNLEDDIPIPLCACSLIQGAVIPLNQVPWLGHRSPRTSAVVLCIYLDCFLFPLCLLDLDIEFWGVGWADCELLDFLVCVWVAVDRSGRASHILIVFHFGTVLLTCTVY